MAVLGGQAEMNLISARDRMGAAHHGGQITTALDTDMNVTFRAEPLDEPHRAGEMRLLRRSQFELVGANSEG